MATEQISIKLDPKYDHYDYPAVAPVPQSGHPGHTTPEQDAQVYQLRMALEAEGYKERLDTLTMLRFLRARKFNVEAAKKMFVDCEAWRKQFGGGVDELVKTFKYTEKPEMFKYYPQYYHKTDKDGRPVYIEELGKIDLRAMHEISTDQRMLQNLVVEYEKLAIERLPACSRKAGYLLETCCTIMDAKGVGVTSIPSVYGFIGQASAISQNYYPERLGKLYVINAPWGFSSVFSVIKRFLDPVTVAKIHVLGSGYETELLKQVPPENLPKQFGGSCDCEGGCQFSDLGPWHEPEWENPRKEKKEDVDVIENNPELDASEGVPDTAGETPAVPQTDGQPEVQKEGAAVGAMAS